jgi:hypothetical protein
LLRKKTVARVFAPNDPRKTNLTFIPISTYIML